MTKYAIALDYLGTAYKGWQAQNDQVKTIQAELEKALSFVANEPISVVCAGRTDAGVHAARQIVHFETAVEREMHSWVLGTNTQLPDDVAVKWIMPVADDFHARFSAKSRRYRYFIMNQRQRSSLYHGRAYWHCMPLHHEKMHEAAQYLLGEHDFSSFRAVECQSKTPMRHVDFIHITRQHHLICVDIQANAFLHHMVRNIVGTLLPVGESKIPPCEIETILNARDRTVAGVTAPAEGLYMVDVAYPETYDLLTEPLFSLFEGHNDA